MSKKSPGSMPLLAAVALLAASAAQAAMPDVAQLAATLKGQAEAAHAAAQPPPDGPKPPRIRNWMLRKEIKNLKGLAEQLEHLATREKHRKILLRAQQGNIVMTKQRIQFHITVGAARHLDGVKPAIEACKATIDQINQALWSSGNDGGGQEPQPSPPPPPAPPPPDDPPPADPPADPPAEPPPAEPPGDEPPGDEPPGDEPPADEPPADEPPGDEPAPPPGDEPPPEKPPADAEPAPEDPPASAVGPEGA